MFYRTHAGQSQVLFLYILARADDLVILIPVNVLVIAVL